MLTQLSVRRYAHHHALLIVFLSSAIWGVLWVPMRYAESFGISGLWVVTLFHLLPAIAILPFIARAYIADRRHRLVSLIAGGLMGIGFVLYGLGLVVASVTKTTVLFYLTPVWATLFAYVALSESVGLLAGTAAFVMGDVFPERHRLIAVLPVALLASTVVFLP